MQAKSQEKRPSFALASTLAVLQLMAKRTYEYTLWLVFPEPTQFHVVHGGVACGVSFRTKSPFDKGYLELLAFIATKNRRIHCCVCCSATRVGISCSQASGHILDVVSRWLEASASHSYYIVDEICYCFQNTSWLNKRLI